MSGLKTAPVEQARTFSSSRLPFLNAPRTAPRVTTPTVPADRLPEAPFSATGPQTTAGFDGRCAALVPATGVLLGPFAGQKRSLRRKRDDPPAPILKKAALGPEELATRLQGDLQTSLTDFLEEKRTKFQQRYTRFSEQLAAVQAQLSDLPLMGESEISGRLERKLNTLGVRERQLRAKLNSLTSNSDQRATGRLAHYAAAPPAPEVIEDFEARFCRDEPPVTIHDTLRCDQCHLDMQILPIEGFIQCPGCLETMPYNEWLPFSSTNTRIRVDDADLVSFADKKVKEFVDFLLSVQGKKRIAPLEADFPLFVQFFASHYPAATRETFGFAQVKLMLTTLGKGKYLKYASLIQHRLLGEPPVTLTMQQQYRFRSMFASLIEPYLLYKSPERKHFISPAYCGWQFSRIEGYTELLVLFRLLKDPKKVAQQDQVFARICRATGWRFEQALAGIVRDDEAM